MDENDERPEMGQEQLYNALVAYHDELERAPPEAHLLCPKIDDDDVVNYTEPDQADGDVTVEEKKVRLKASEDRLLATYYLSLLMGLAEEHAGSWPEEWRQKTEKQLKKCDGCVRKWHRHRGPFLRTLREHFKDEQADVVEKLLNEFDKARIDKGLANAKRIIEENGPMSTGKLASADITAVLALFEALCSMPYLALPDNRVDFNFVFQQTQTKKPLKMQGGIIPTMTYFLFDPDPYRNKFATTAWERLPANSLPQDTWDWAVNDHLADAVSKVSSARGIPTPDQICRFWTGFLLILNSLSEELVFNCLRAMEVSPSVYYLAMDHLAMTHSDDALSHVLEGLRALMEKSSKAFWEAYDQTAPSYLVAQITGSPAFRSLLAHSFVPDKMVGQDGRSTPALAVWMQMLFRSLLPRQRSDLCGTLLHELFDVFRVDPSCPPEGRATCTLTGLVALRESLEGFLQPQAFPDCQTSLIMVNQLLSRVVKYKGVITSAAELKPTDKYNVGLSDMAMGVVRAALSLDAKATNMEWNAIHDGLPVQSNSDRQSGALWESFIEMLWAGQVDLAKTMLMATLPLRAIEQFKPPRNTPALPEIKQRFNNRYQEQATAIGKILGRLTDFAPADLDMFCSGVRSQTMQPIVASLVHGEATVQEAGFELIKEITQESAPREAVHQMLNSYFETFLSAFSEALTKITVDKDSNNPWSPMATVMKCSEYILHALSDPSEGLLRSKVLTAGERAVVERWWQAEWRTIDYCFSQLKYWHTFNDKKIMENFCRDVMELADKFLAQDGVIAAALDKASSASLGGAQLYTEGDAKSLGGVLKPVALNSAGLVEMLQLRDIYLIQGIVGVLHKLLRRSSENNIALPRRVMAQLESMLKKRSNPGSKGDYVLRTNLSDAQRVSLLRELGWDTPVEEEYSHTKSLDKAKALAAKLQSRLDFSKGTPAIKSDTSVIETKGADQYKKSGLSGLKSLLPPKAKVAPKLDEKAVLAKQMSIKEQRQREKEEKARRDAEIIAKAKALRTIPGEGSGMIGISGARGKDHAPAAALQRDEMMVGSSSESEDDDDDDELIIQRGTGKKSMDEVERRRMRALAAKQRGPVRKTKIIRSAKDMRARLIPAMDVLHQAILEWDIFHESNDPPNGYKCLSVADAYPSPHDYKQTFFPLLINEAWRSFVTAKDESTSKPYGIKILNRMTVDKFIEVTTSMPAKDNKDRMLSEGDIVVISQGHDPLNQSDVLHCLARIYKKTHKRDSLEVVYRLNSKGNQIMPILLPGREFHATKITNMTTIEREYAALESLQYYDLMDEVLKAEPSPILQFGQEAVDNVARNYDLNQGQAKAILNAKENDGFTLIQGPPGTGKTKTIVAMVGSLLTPLLRQGAMNGGAVSLTGPGQHAANGGALQKKLLVCAPSNAAVDELVFRLKAGVKTTHGATHKINVIRLGRSEAINAGVRDATLDELVKAKLDAAMNENNNGNSRDQMHKEAGEIKTQIAEMRPQLEASREGEDRNLTTRLQREFDELKRRQAHIGARIDADKSSGNTVAREVEIKRRQIQQQILDGAHVLCATLSGSGHEMFKNLNVEFETVIIDEAAQCVELSALIPLKYGCAKCILVGDPKQLPPTVLSQSAARYGYDQSLFVRMQKNHAKDVHLLDMQYRMHPEISQYPSAEFYEGLLRDGDDMAKLRRQPWHQSALLGPYRFFDVRGSQERGPRNQSLVNEEELKVAMQLYERFRTDYGGKIELQHKIGIITPYKAQLIRLRQKFQSRYGENITDIIEFNTTDAFQGRECEIIIFSCVRASPTGGIGFMTDIRRMNVGLTRAKSSLWILGDSRALAQGEYWKKLIEDAQQRDRYTTGNIIALLNKPQSGAQGSVTASRPSVPHNTASPLVEEDVVMLDGPSLPAGQSDAFSSRDSPQMAQQPPFRPPQSRPPSNVTVEKPRPSASDLLKGPTVPIIKATRSPPPDGVAGKKRPADDADGLNQPPGKKIKEPQLMRRPIPTGPKAMRMAPKPEKQPKKDSDPTAEQVLGLVPPVRHPAEAPHSGNNYPTPNTVPPVHGSGQQGQGQGPGGLSKKEKKKLKAQDPPPNMQQKPKAKPPADPFLRRRR